ncbi:DUF4249 domain-containing protein [Arcticibacter eurypsychrophilus]|uniref:DUF4249 domain-containing protein n=1 Tax=Arcticibacter eurypsychrophilus TaxID=1434752 RepID=UPI00084CF3BC|nr:DUF4249 domain-containing protein [Arcticibacter eurypsychrophilus]
MKIVNLLIVMFFSSLLFSSCEDTIDFKTNEGTPALVVEGWLTNLPGNQYVKLYLTKTLAEKNSYPPVTNATLTLNDDAGNKEVLKEVSPGKYEIANLKGVEGRTYTLRILCSEGSYEVISKMPRISMAPDSIRIKYEEKSIVHEDAGYYPFIYGQELPGEGDYMLVKLYRNNTYLNKANDINFFSDEFVDGNYISETELQIDTPFVKDDVIKAEVWSLTRGAFDFWADLSTQLQSGGIFASPLTNSRANVQKLTESSRNVTGYFGTSLVESVERKVE